MIPMCLSFYLLLFFQYVYAAGKLQFTRCGIIKTI